MGGVEEIVVVVGGGDAEGEAKAKREEGKDTWCHERPVVAGMCYEYDLCNTNSSVMISGWNI